jgi:uncharacterized DUF497 family protein
MKLVDDPEMASWLAQFAGRPQDFDWDAGNLTKNRKHRIEQADVEALFHLPLVFVGYIVEPPHDEDRWLALGQNTEGRRLALVFTRRGSRLRAISCRSMRPKEKKIYEDTRQEDN